MGPPEFSVPTLEALKNSGYDILAVYSQPASKANRGQKLVKSKIEVIAKELYGANVVECDDKIKKQIDEMEKAGFIKFPVCIAKTQYSFSTDSKLKGAPSGHALTIREVRLSSGAKFIVVICGSIMTMPGLPKTPAADKIKLNKKGEIEGLF